MVGANTTHHDKNNDERYIHSLAVGIDGAVLHTAKTNTALVVAMREEIRLQMDDQKFMETLLERECLMMMTFLCIYPASSSTTLYDPIESKTNARHRGNTTFF